jgi:hypothetical protein
MTPIRCVLLEVARRETNDTDGGGTITFPVYRHPETGQELRWSQAPVGAMAYTDPSFGAGPDGKCLMVKVPANPDGSGEATWIVDDKRHAWQRSGTPPDATAHPSIFINQPHGWHGWLENGYLRDA